MQARSHRRVHIILAERGTGLALWKDQLDNLSCYAVDKENKLFHSLHFSKDHRERVGISWDHEGSASLFLDRVESLTSRPDNVGLSGPKTQGEVQVKKKAKLSKAEISRPCGFTHNVSITMEDRDTFYTMMAGRKTRD